MLGVAKYLGFSKAVLIGCDYLGTPPFFGHFYADRKPFYEADEDYLVEYRARLKVAAEGIDVTVIVPEGSTSLDFKYDSYENYFGLERKYRENAEFVDSEQLDLLREAARSRQVYM